MALQLPQFPSILVCFLLICSANSTTNVVDIPFITLSNGEKLPLIGMGVGNLQHERIVDMVKMGATHHGIRLVDTARASHNEHLIHKGISQFSDQQEFHVITKVWYTHLGYNRTMLSVEESLEQLHAPNIKVHVLLHWPRCRKDISWMDCEGEEERLPVKVKNAGPPPNLNENAYIESWRALEDLYQAKDEIASIGVSNFNLDDFKNLMKTGHITPHLLQANVWTLLFDPSLVTYLHQHEIHFQAYNVMNGILSQTSRAPNAYQSLMSVAANVSQNGDEMATPAQLIIAWLVHQSVSVIPRTSSVEHLQENAESMQTVPSLSSQQQDTIKTAVMALLRGVDLNPPRVTFHNTANQVAHVFWVSGNEEVPVKQHLQPNESFQSQTYPGHVFAAYDEARNSRTEYEISVSYGAEQEFHIEL